MRHVILSAVLGALGAAAHADTITWDGGGGNGNWTNRFNWDGNVLPGASDRVVIPDNTPTVVFIPDDEEITIDTIAVGLNSTLRIRERVILTLENNDRNCDDSGPAPTCPLYDNHLIDGLIEFPIDQGDAGTIRFVTNPHVIGGVGTIRSEIFVASIEIDGDVVLTNRLDGSEAWQGIGGIRGSMHIEGNAGTSFNGTFVNEGLVIADALTKPGILISAEIEDDSTARFVLSDCSNVGLTYWIEFEQGSTFLDSDFVDHGGGEFRFHESVYTCGVYARMMGAQDSCGGIDLRGSPISFRYKTFETTPGDPCPNPGTPAPDSMSCGIPWMVDADVARVNE